MTEDRAATIEVSTSPASRLRRIAALAAVVVSTLGLTIEVAAHWNPWRYVHLMPLSGRGLSLGLTASVLVLLAVAAVTGSRRRPGRLAADRAVLTAAILIATAVILLVCGWPILNWDASLNSYEPGESTTVAVSSDGRFEVVSTVYASDSDSDYFFQTLTIRSRAGLWSRESAKPIANIGYQNGRPDVQVSVVRFVDVNEIEMSTSDARQFVITFEPRTLEPAHELTNCEDDSDQLCSN